MGEAFSDDTGLAPLGYLANTIQVFYNVDED